MLERIKPEVVVLATYLTQTANARGKILQDSSSIAKLSWYKIKICAYLVL